MLLTIDQFEELLLPGVRDDVKQAEANQFVWVLRSVMNEDEGCMILTILFCVKRNAHGHRSRPVSSGYKQSWPTAASADSAGHRLRRLTWYWRCDRNCAPEAVVPFDYCTTGTEQELCRTTLFDRDAAQALHIWSSFPCKDEQSIGRDGHCCRGRQSMQG